jgi:hypothetical protein
LFCVSFLEGLDLRFHLAYQNFLLFANQLAFFEALGELLKLLSCFVQLLSILVVNTYFFQLKGFLIGFAAFFDKLLLCFFVQLLVLLGFL